MKNQIQKQNDKSDEQMFCYFCNEPMEDGTGYTMTKGKYEGETLCDECYEAQRNGVI